MDFFEAQDRAKRRTTPLVLLFGLAVLGTIVALYFAFVAGTGLYGLRANSHGGGLERIPGYAGSLADIDWWQPGALCATAWLVIPIVGGSALFKWFQLRAGGPAVAAELGGRPVSPATTHPRERQLLNIVEEMALASGMSVPAVYVLPGEGSINAFAAGYSRADAVIAVTRGALERLDRDELQGVVAHEFSHILNGDMRLNTRLIALLYGILAIVILGRGMIRAAFEASHNPDTGKKERGFVLPLAAIGLAIYVIGSVGHLFGRAFQAAACRQREHLADAAAVQFTRNPGGLAGALKKLGASAFRGHLTHPAASEVSHVCFAQNFRPSVLGPLFDTHPPLDARIRLLDPSFAGTYPDLPPLDPSAPPVIPDAPPRPTPVPYTAPVIRRTTPAAFLAAAGIPTSDTLAAARQTIAGLPDTISDAARDPAQAPALACAICLTPGQSSASRDHALNALAGVAGRDFADHAGRLQARLASISTSQHLNLLRLAAPALRQLDIATRDLLLESLDAIVHADDRVSPREFAFQKIVSRELRLAERPRDALSAIGPSQASPHLSVALSAAARIDDRDDETALALFAQASAHFAGLQPPLVYTPADQATLGHLDLALDQLALTPAPFRRRVLAALASAFAADNTLSPDEADLLRAIAAALDCPVPTDFAF